MASLGLPIGKGDQFIGGLQRRLRAMLLTPFVGQSLSAFVAKANTETLEAINDLVAEGKVGSAVGRRYRWSRPPMSRP